MLIMNTMKKYFTQKSIFIVSTLVVVVLLLGTRQSVLSSYSSAPGVDPTAGNVEQPINFDTNPQSKDCSGVGLNDVTLSLCHDSQVIPSPLPMGFEYPKALRSDSIISSGPMTVAGKLVADLSPLSGVGDLVKNALILTSGIETNITTITSNKSRLGVWSDKLNKWANGRFGRLDTEKLIITSPTLDNTYIGGTVDPYRATSFTTSLGAVTTLDLAGTTNLGYGNICYTQAFSKGCIGKISLGAPAYDQTVPYIKGFSPNSVTCQDIDPVSAPSAQDHVSAIGSGVTFDCGGTAPLPPTESFVRTYSNPTYSNNYVCSLSGSPANQFPPAVVTEISNNGIIGYFNNQDSFLAGTNIFNSPNLTGNLAVGKYAVIYNGDQYFLNVTSSGVVGQLFKCN